eukprot:6414392-Prymnesium_polylepis.1
MGGLAAGGGWLEGGGSCVVALVRRDNAKAARSAQRAGSGVLRRREWGGEVFPHAVAAAAPRARWRLRLSRAVACGVLTRSSSYSICS